MSPPSRARDATILLCSILAVVIGSTQLFLETSVLSAFEHKLRAHSTSWPPHHWYPTDPKPLRLVPQDLATAETRVIVASALLSVLAGGVGTYRSLNGGSQRVWKPATAGSSIAAALLAAASFLYVQAEAWALSARFEYTNFYSAGQHFTREGWTCQMKDFYRDDPWTHWGGICWAARGGRWLFFALLPTLAVLAWRSLDAVSTDLGLCARVARREEAVELMSDDEDEAGRG